MGVNAAQAAHQLLQAHLKRQNLIKLLPLQNMRATILKETKKDIHITEVSSLIWKMSLIIMEYIPSVHIKLIRETQIFLIVSLLKSKNMIVSKNRLICKII